MKTGRRTRGRQLLSCLLCTALLVTSFPAMAFGESISPEATTAETKVAEDAAVTEGKPDMTESEAVELTELREETVKHFRNKDGSFTAVNYMTPVHYKEDGEHEWTEIDNTLYSIQTRAEGESVTKYIPQSSPVDVQITDTADSDVLVRLQGEEHQISWNYENLKTAKAEKKPKKDKLKKEKSIENAPEQYFTEEVTDHLTDGLVKDEGKKNLGNIEVKFTNLSVTEARIVEQILISAYTLDNLQNARREIAKGNVNKAKGNMENIICIFGSAVEDELLNLMGV